MVFFLKGGDGEMKSIYYLILLAFLVIPYFCRDERPVFDRTQRPVYDRSIILERPVYDRTDCPVCDSIERLDLIQL